MRPKVYAALFLSLAFALVCALPDGAARAQRRGRQQPPAGQSNANGGAASQRREASKRVFVGGGSDTAQGTRQTIKSDNPLNDYSAYRSGDRFYVVLPKSDAGSVARGAGGRGYSDMQVQQRGSDVVLSYRLKPGAKPRVEQKFNRLDVVFEVPEGGRANAAQQNNAQPNPSQQNQPRQTPAANERPANAQAQNQPAAAQQNAANAQRNQPAQTAQTQTAGQPSATQPASPLTTTPDLSQAGQAGGPTPATPAGEGQPPADAPAAQELAQAQPPASTAPATTTTATTNPAPGAQAGTSIGSVVLNNWPVALAALLALIGLGLVIAARRSSAFSPTHGAEETKLKDASAATPDKAATAAAVALKPASAPASAETKNAHANKSGRKAEAARVDGPAGVEKARPSAESPAVAGPASDNSGVAAVAAVAGLSALGSQTSGDETKADKGETKPVAPAAPHGPDKVRAEAARLFAGEEYDRSVVGSSDAMARQMVSAELLAALNGRDAEKRERARAALAEHGYYNDLLRDLRSASAPAERAAAARSLGLVGDRSAAPQLIKALEDNSIDVRRAAVESLASLRDPSAIPALEALVRREKKQKNKVNRKLIQSAIESSRPAKPEAAPVTPTPEIVAAAPAVVDEIVETEAPSSEADETPTVAAEAAAHADVEHAAVGADETLTVEVARADAASISASPVVEEAASAEPEEITIAAPAAEIVEPAADESAVVSRTGAAEIVEVEETAPAPETAEPSAAEPAFAAATEEPSPIEPAPAELISAEPEPEPAVVEPDAQTPPVAARIEDSPVEDSPVAAPEVAPEQVMGLAPYVADAAETSPAADEAVNELHEREQVAEARVAEPDAPSLEETFTQTHVVETPVAEDAFAVKAEAEPAAEAEEAPSAEVAAAHETRAETAVENRAETVSEDWVEFDLSEAGNPELQAPAESPVFVIETSAGGVFDSPAPVENAPALFDEAPAEPSTASAQAAADEVSEPPVEKGLAFFEGGPLRGDTAAGVADIEDAPRERPFGAAAPITRHSAIVPVAEAGFAGSSRPTEEKGIEAFDADSTVPATIQQRLASREPADRASALADLSRLPTDEAFRQICVSFDDEAKEVRSAAARALFDHKEDRAESFTRALRESSPERRRQIGAAINSSGLATEAISQLTGEGREKTYESFSILFLMAKAGEVQPLLRAIEGHPNNEVRLAVVKLLALSGQKEILPAFRRLAVRGSLPTDVRSAVMEAIYQISSQNEPTPAA